MKTPMKTPFARTVTALAAVAAVAIAASAPFASAQDDPVGPGKDGGSVAPAPAAAKDAVHTAWDAFGAARAQVMAAQTELRAAAGAKDEARIAAARARSTAAQTEMRAAGTAFQDALAAADRSKIDAAADKDLLGQGLQMLIGDAMSKKHDGKAAVALCEEFIARLSDTPAAKYVANDVLADACLMAGDIARAEKIWETASAGDDVGLKCNGLMNLGDLKSARGDFEGARASWQKVGDLAAAAGPRDPAGQQKPYVEQRLALIGSPAPEVDSKDWIDGAPAALTAMRGKVVVVDMWATWCPPCRDAMPGLDKLYRARKKDGLEVLGVTRFYKNGFLPTAGTKEPVTDGVRMDDLTPESFPAHLRQFKENLGISYPFVTTATDAEFKAYKVQGIPTMAVVDREGKVVFVKVGGGDETLLTMAVDRALAAK